MIAPTVRDPWKPGPPTVIRVVGHVGIPRKSVSSKNASSPFTMHVGQVRRRLGPICSLRMLYAEVLCQAALAGAVSPSSCSLGAPLVREGIEITDDQKWS